MTWQTGVASFFGGAFLANFTPHFIAGVLGQEFPTPFSRPPFRGRSSPPVNMLYGLLNLGVAWLLLSMPDGLTLRLGSAAGVAAVGFGLWSLLIARSAATFRRGSPS